MMFSIVSAERAAEQLGVPLENVFRIAAYVGAGIAARIDGRDYFYEAAVEAMKHYLEKKSR